MTMEDFNEYIDDSVLLERQVIGLALHEGTAREGVAHVEPEWFTDPRHSHVWTLIQEHINAGEQFDPMTVWSDLKSTPPERRRNIDPAYLADCYSSAPQAVLARKYAEELRGQFQRRQAQAAGQHYAQLLEGGMDPAAAKAEFDALMEGVTGSNRSVTDTLEVRAEARRIQIRNQARQLASQADAAEIELPQPIRLDELLAEPDEETFYLIDQLWPEDNHALLYAQPKAGKTTLSHSVLRSLADGVPFLGKYATRQVSKIAVLDNELAREMGKRWLRDQGIKNTQAVDQYFMRGRLHTFDIRQPALRSRWADRLRGAEVLFIDCFRPILDALGLDENTDSSMLFGHIEELAVEAEIPNVFIVHHAGLEDGRPRGGTGLSAKPAALWSLTFKNRNAGLSGPRYFSAEGRDVSVPRTEIMLDESTRHYHVTESETDNKADQIGDDITVYLLEHPGVSKSQIDDDVTAKFGHTRSSVRRALGALIDAGKVRIEEGPRRAQKHYVSAGHNASTPVRHSPPSVRQRTAVESVRQSAGGIGIPRHGALTDQLETGGTGQQVHQLETTERQ